MLIISGVRCLSITTIDLKTIVENGYNLGLNLYPIFDENYRAILNDKIIKRYYFNEIAFESPARFIFELNSKLSIIMPYFNRMYTALTELDKIGFDELLKKSIGSETIRNLLSNDIYKQNVDRNSDTTHNNTIVQNSTTNYGRVSTDTKNTKTTSEQTADGKQLNLDADTPQSQISATLSAPTDWDKSPLVSNGNYSVLNSGKNETTNTGTDSNTLSGSDTTNTNTNDAGLQQIDENTKTDSTDDKTEREVIDTYNFDYMNTFKQIYELIVNIDLQILGELRELFLTVY